VKVTDLREKLQASGINVVEAIQVRSMRQNQDTKVGLPLKPLLIESISLLRSISKVSFISQICGMHIKVEASVEMLPTFRSQAAKLWLRNWLARLWK
jgi:hypothetical protein